MLPDLAKGSILLQITTGAGWYAACLNQKLDGTPFAMGARVTIINDGMGRAGPYGVFFYLLGKISQDMGAPTEIRRYCVPKLLDTEGLEPGKSRIFLGPQCCHFSNLPVGQYQFVVVIDDRNHVAETNEDNNDIASEPKMVVATGASEEPSSSLLELSTLEEIAPPLSR